MTLRSSTYRRLTAQAEVAIQPRTRRGLEQMRHILHTDQSCMSSRFSPQKNRQLLLNRQQRLGKDSEFCIFLGSREGLIRDRQHHWKIWNPFLPARLASYIA